MLRRIVDFFNRAHPRTAPFAFVMFLHPVDFALRLFFIEMQIPVSGGHDNQIFFGKRFGRFFLQKFRAATGAFEVREVSLLGAGCAFQRNDFIRRVDIPQGGDEHVRQFDAVLVEILVAVVATVMPFLPPDPYKSPRYHLSISRMHDFQP